MKKLTVDKALLIEMYGECGRPLRAKIETELPELFEKKFKAGDWAVVDDKDWDYGIVRLTKIKQRDGTKTLCSEIMVWDLDSYYGRKTRHATPEEIKAHLTKEAERRGYSMETTIMSMIIGDRRTMISKGERRAELFNYKPESDELYFNGWMVYRQGQWATIVEDSIEMTVEEAVKRLEGETGKKIKITLS